MTFSIAETISRLWAPRHKASCSWFLWRRLTAALVERGHDHDRESGAFLVGRRHEGRIRIVDFVLYDDLDPNCLETGIVRFDGRYFSALWELCKKSGLTVVADVHTHPGSELQSDSDRAHPMISRADHVAFILPRFGAPPLHVSDVGIYRYEGAKKWSAVPVRDRCKFFHIGL